MGKSPILISPENRMLARLARHVSAGACESRSRAIQAAVDEKIRRANHARLARECAKLDREAEKLLAEEGIAEAFAESTCPP